MANPLDPRRAATLLELLLGLALGSILLGVLAPFARAPIDRLAVLGAADATAAAFAQARLAAAAHAGAVVTLDPDSGLVRITVGDAGIETLRLADEFGVELDVVGARGPVRLEFSALGIGTFASRAVRLRRRGVEARLAVSSYGRVRRW